MNHGISIKTLLIIVLSFSFLPLATYAADDTNQTLQSTGNEPMSMTAEQNKITGETFL